MALASDKLLRKDVEEALQSVTLTAVKALLGRSAEEDPSYYRGMYAAVRQLQTKFNLDKELNLT